MKSEILMLAYHVVVIKFAKVAEAAYLMKKVFWVLSLCLAGTVCIYNPAYSASSRSSSDCGLELDVKKAYEQIPHHTRVLNLARILSVQKTERSSKIIVYVLEEGEDGYKGMFESTDGTKTWKPVQDLIRFTTLFIDDVTAVQHYISAVNPRVLYRKLENRAEYERSDDGGYTWVGPRFMIEGDDVAVDFKFVELHPESPYTIYARVSPPKGEKRAFKSGIYVSRNGGESWSFLTNEVEALSISSSNTSIMYGLYRTLYTNQIKRSTNNGRTWELVGQSEVFNTPWEQDTFSFRKENHYKGLSKEDLEKRRRLDSLPRIKQLVIDPHDSEIVYLVTTYGIVKSTNGGKSWRLLNVGVRYANNVTSLATDSSNHNVLYVGTKMDGFYKSTDQGCTWEKIEIHKRLVK